MGINGVYFFVFFFVYSSCCFSQSTVIIISGKVWDRELQSPIDQANIYLPESPHFTQSNVKGFYEITIPYSSEVKLRCSRLGYEVSTITLTIEKHTTKITQDFYLQLTMSEEIEVKARKNIEGNIIREDPTSFELLPTISGNIESVLPSIALGVRSSAGGELSSQYSVRGGSYDENLVFVNDFEIFRPQLIRNGQQEGLSFPNADLIKELHFSSGGFEPKYGDKLSSVLDIKYKVPDSLRASISLSALGVTSHIEGKYMAGGKRKLPILYLGGLRYKSTKYILGSTELEGEYQPNFFDVQSYVSIALKPYLKLDWIANVNTSSFHLVPESSTIGKGSIFQAFSLRTFYEGKELDEFKNSMTGLSLTYYPERKRNPFFVKYLSSFYASQEAEQFDILGYYRLVEIDLGANDQEGREIKLWGEGTQHQYVRNYLKTYVHHQELRGGHDLNQGIWNHHFIQWGLFIRQEFFDDRINEWERIDSAGYSLPYLGEEVLLNSVYKTKHTFDNVKFSAWLQDELDITAGENQLFKITGGFRAHTSVLNGEFLFQPRLKLEGIPLQHPKALQYWISSGWYHQSPFYREMRLPIGDLNFDVKSQKSFHVVGGVKMDFRMPKISDGKFRWISELYYKDLWDVTSYELDNVRIRYSGQNDATAFAIGWDNRINGEFVRGVESWINISFLRTRESLKGVQHKIRSLENPEGEAVKDVPRPTDQLFAIGIFFQDYLPQNENFKMNMNLNVAGGLPYGLKGDNIVYRNDSRLKPYHRVDIGFSYLLWDQKARRARANNWFAFTRQAWVSLEVFNLLKVKNEASIQWIKSIYNYQFAIPNHLSSRRINLKIRLDF